MVGLRPEQDVVQDPRHYDPDGESQGERRQRMLATARPVRRENWRRNDRRRGHDPRRPERDARYVSTQLRGRIPDDDRDRRRYRQVEAADASPAKTDDPREPTASRCQQLKEPCNHAAILGGRRAGLGGPDREQAAEAAYVNQAGSRPRRRPAGTRPGGRRLGPSGETAPRRRFGGASCPTALERAAGPTIGACLSGRA